MDRARLAERTRSMTIIVLEGADQSGKTTLASHLVNVYGAYYMHAKVWKQMLKWHSGIMRRAVRLSARGELVVLDRHWISEFVYGSIFRGGPAYDGARAAHFDQLILQHGIYILCVPSDPQGQLAPFHASPA